MTQLARFRRHQPTGDADPYLTMDIVWVDDPAAEALRRSQARVLQDLLAALDPCPSRAPSEDEQETSP